MGFGLTGKTISMLADFSWIRNVMKSKMSSAERWVDPSSKTKPFSLGLIVDFDSQLPEAEHNSSLYRPRISGVGISPD